MKVNEWRPNEEHSRYVNDPSFIDERFGLRPLPQLLEDKVLGVVRFTVMPAFDGESVYTLIYRANEVLLHSAVAGSSLWSSLANGTWSRPSQTQRTLPVSSLPKPLHQWAELKAAALAAPTVEIAVIDGSEYATLDGVSFRHRIQDSHDSFEAEWHNPTSRASNHISQMVLVNAYDLLISTF